MRCRQSAMEWCMNHQEAVHLAARAASQTVRMRVAIARGSYIRLTRGLYVAHPGWVARLRRGSRETPCGCCTSVAEESVDT
jgi:cytidine deaminase